MSSASSCSLCSVADGSQREFLGKWILVKIISKSNYVFVDFFYSFINGDPRLLIYPSDSNGEICGKGDYENETRLLFYDITRCLRTSAVLGCPTKQVCN